MRTALLIGLPVLWLVLMAILFSWKGWANAIRAKVSQPSREARAIGHLLALEPEAWTASGDVLVHAGTNICVKAAAKYDAVHWWRDQPHASKTDPHPIEDRRHVHRAVQAWRQGADGDSITLAAEAAVRRLAYRLPPAARGSDHDGH